MEIKNKFWTGETWEMSKLGPFFEVICHRLVLGSGGICIIDWSCTVHILINIGLYNVKVCKNLLSWSRKEVLNRGHLRNVQIGTFLCFDHCSWAQEESASLIDCTLQILINNGFCNLCYHNNVDFSVESSTFTCVQCLTYVQVFMVRRNHGLSTPE